MVFQQQGQQVDHQACLRDYSCANSTHHRTYIEVKQREAMKPEHRSTNILAIILSSLSLLRVANAETQLATGADYTCVFESETEVNCWGNNGYGAYGDGTTTTVYEGLIFPSNLRLQSSPSPLIFAFAPLIFTPQIFAPLRWAARHRLPSWQTGLENCGEVRISSVCSIHGPHGVLHWVKP